MWVTACVPHVHIKGEWVPSVMRGSLPLLAALLAAGAGVSFVVAGVWVLGKEFLLHDSSLYHYAVEVGNSKAV